MRLNYTILAAALFVALSTGCATQIPITAERATLTPEELARTNTDAWGSSAAITQDGSQAFVLHMPVTPPKDIKNKRLSIEMAGPMSIPDIAQLLGRYGIPVVVPDLGEVGGGTVASPATGAVGTTTTTQPTTTASGGRKVFIPRYTGTVGGFLAAVSRATDTWFIWEDGFVQATPMAEVVVSVPQDVELQKAIKTAMGELDAKDVSASLEAGLLVFKLPPSAVPKVRTFIERAVANAALITMQVAMVSVTTDQDAKQGLDWSRLQMALGAGVGTPENLMNTFGSTTSTTTTPTTSTDPGQGAYYSGSLLRIAAGTNRFSLIGFIDFLNKYGAAKTLQNATVTALASYEVNLSSVTKVPYVSSVSSTTSGTTGSSTGSSQTSTAQDGITIKMKPLYDRASGMVTLPIDVKVEAVISFNNLSAGNEIGTLTQPTTGQRSITDTLRMRPGETMVIGGITFDSVSRNDGLPLFLQSMAGKGLESQALTVKRNSMYIVVRSTVRLTPPILEQEGFELTREAVRDSETAPIKKKVETSAPLADIDEQKAVLAPTQLPAVVAEPVIAKAKAKAKAKATPARKRLRIKPATAVSAATEKKAIAETPVPAPLATTPPVHATAEEPKAASPTAGSREGFTEILHD